jgi:DNA-binding CsgD family transcriptional regulator
MTLALGAAVPSLTRWGLSSDADLVFRTAASFGPRSARALAAELGLTRARVDTALGELRENGAVVEVPGAPGSVRRSSFWAARPAAEVVHEVRARRLRLVDDATMARRHHGVLQLLNARLSGVGIPLRPTVAGTVDDGVRLLPNRQVAGRRLAELVTQERHDHLVINTEPVDNAAKRAVVPLDRSQFDQTVENRVLSRPPIDGDTETKFAQFYGPNRFHYRQLPETPLKLFICDRRTALFPVDPLDFGRGFLELTRPEVVAALITLFDRLWTTAVDPRLHGVPAITLSARERDLIDLLALGHTDATAAQELRISTRSVTNVLRTLMDRIGVENRFQLGLALGALEVAVPPALEVATASAAPSISPLKLAS